MVNSSASRAVIVTSTGGPPRPFRVTAQAGTEPEPRARLCLGLAGHWRALECGQSGASGPSLPGLDSDYFWATDAEAAEHNLGNRDMKHKKKYKPGPVITSRTRRMFRPWKSAEEFFQTGRALIGVRNICSDGVVLRVFYPAEPEMTSRDAMPASWFRTSLMSMVDGLVHVHIGGKFRFCRNGSFPFQIVRLVVRTIFYILPLRNASIPCCYMDLPPRCPDAQRAPLILWSHGLTGNGDEHSLLAAALAADGNVVALLHHRDGSSNKVDLADGRALYYTHPDFRIYNPAMRQKQAEHRTAELGAAQTLLLGGGAGADLAALIDPASIAVGGFSFGATTAALAAAADGAGSRYRCAILWDGWFRLDLPRLGIAADMPTQAFSAASPQAPHHHHHPHAMLLAAVSPPDLPRTSALACQRGDSELTQTAGRDSGRRHSC